ncbi:calcium-binding protein [Nocardioides sp. CN2-186]|uniref:calcium-binding protein n=1 Tax=Nocardioides tweenelious TaxID=3156607 RepID=UPI0032B3D456
MHSGSKRTGFILAVATATAAALAWTPAAPAGAADETCHGVPATIVVTGVSPGSLGADGTEGDDVIVVATSDYLHVFALGGNDLVCNGANTYTDAGAGDDVVWGGSTDTGISSNGLYGGFGNDQLYGGPGRDDMTGGPGDDVLSGGAGNDELAGGDGNRSDLAADPDHDSVDAGPGDDTVYDDVADDEFHGGDGHDTFYLSNFSDDPVDEHCYLDNDPTPVLDVATGTVTGLGSDTFDGFETYVGGDYDQTLIGSDGADDLRSNRCGHALIDGRGGDDTLVGDSVAGGTIRGGDGSDLVTIAGTYTVHGGSGVDRVTLTSASRATTDGSRIFGGDGSDWLVIDRPAYSVTDLRSGLWKGGKRRVVVDTIENARLLQGGNQLHKPTIMVGTAGANVLDGPPDYRLRGPRTVLRGLGGPDTLLGGPHDTADGGPGHDTCRAPHRIHCEAR